MSRCCEALKNMSDANPGAVPEMPASVSQEIAREKSVRRGTLANIHRWWARCPSITARLATYMGLAGQVASDDAVLRDLGEVEPAPSVMDSARRDIRDTQWKWLWQRQLEQMAGQPQETPSVPEPPKVLDPFSGGGAIPLEAARLGCDTYANDLNRLAYHILHASLKYPQLFGESDENVAGSSPQGTWNGLASEIRHWANRWLQKAEPLCEDLYPSIAPADGLIPTYYLWLIPVQCGNPACGEVFSPRRDQPLFRRQRGQITLRPERDSQGFSGIIVDLDKERTTSLRDSRVCPHCGTTANDDGENGSEHRASAPALVALVTEEDNVRMYYGVSSSEAEKYAPWGGTHRSRLAELLSQDHATLLSTELRGSCYQALRRWGCLTFADLFLPRQLLVALEYGQCLRGIRDAMVTLGMPKDRHEAIITYLSFFLGWLVLDQA